MTSLAQRNLPWRRIEVASIKEREILRYAKCPKCSAYREYKSKNDKRVKINYDGVWSCNVCKQKSTLGEWLGDGVD